MSTPSYVKDIVEQHLKTFSWSAEITAAAPALTAHPTESEELPMPTQSTPELDEAKRGRPRKNATEEEPEHEHIVMQLRKVVSLRGNYPMTFADGKKSMLSQQSAHKLLAQHDSLKPADKEAFANHIAKSADYLRNTLQGKPIPPPEKKIYLPPVKSLGA